MFAVRRLVFLLYHIVTVDFHMASFVGFGKNVFLRCHIDKDFTMSIIQVCFDTKEKPTHF
jgi:hypothetical protein